MACPLRWCSRRLICRRLCLRITSSFHSPPFRPVPWGRWPTGVNQLSNPPSHTTHHPPPTTRFQTHQATAHHTHRRQYFLPVCDLGIQVLSPQQRAYLTLPGFGCCNDLNLTTSFHSSHEHSADSTDFTRHIPFSVPGWQPPPPSPASYPFPPWPC